MSVPCQFINGQWQNGGGAAFLSIDPSTGREIWQGHFATADDVDTAVTAARHALASWARLSVSERVAFLHRYRDRMAAEKEQLATIIATETGKPLWEARTEVAAMIGKIATSETAYQERTPSRSTALSGAHATLTHRPHGVVAVFGPYNFPGHLPNGHIVPALLAGNTVIFKPSDQTPMVAEAMVRLWEAADLPDGVLNLLQGDRTTGAALAGHAGLDGLFFTGSVAAGTAISRALTDPFRQILALEMGGNNPLVCWDVVSPHVAEIIIASAFVTTGQRCTCARRLIVGQGEEGDLILRQLQSVMDLIVIGGPFGEREPFMGPMISNAAADRLMTVQERLIGKGAGALHPMRRPDQNLPFLTPGLLDVTPLGAPEDEEIFGPLLQVQRVTGFDAAIAAANATKFGLAAGLLSENTALWEQFRLESRAGIINRNRPLTGASSSAPFGGIGASGNHRPSAYYAADYCAYPVASMTSNTPAPTGLPIRGRAR